MKIAIINNWPHWYQGGVEAYTRKMIELLTSNGHQVTEYSTLDPNVSTTGDKMKQVDSYDISNGARFYRKNASKEIKKLLSKDEHDLYLFNSLVTKEFFNSKKTIYIQHIDHTKYLSSGSDWWFNFFNWMFLGIGYWKTPLKHKNIIFYIEKENVFDVDNPIYLHVPISSKLEVIKRDGWGKGQIFWMARHQEPHKGLRNLLNISRKIRNEIIVGGDGPHTRKLKELQKSCIGKIDHEKVMDYYDNSKMFLVTSNYEGFLITAVEALSRGVPVIMFDTFTSVEAYRKCEAVSIIPKGDIEAYAKEVERIDNLSKEEWLKLSHKASSFAAKNFDMKKWDEKFIKYINKIGGKND